MQPDTPGIPEAQAPEDPSGEEATQPQIITEAAAVAVQTTLTSVPTFGKRQSFRNIARSLSAEELCHPGVVKLTIENLDRAEEECEDLRSYMDKFHAADVERNILREQLKAIRALEVAFAVLIGLGCAVIGVTPSFWDATERGPIALGLGIAMVCGGIVVRVVRR
jgi:hypothetical protein